MMMLLTSTIAFSNILELIHPHRHTLSPLANKHGIRRGTPHKEMLHSGQANHDAQSQ